MRRNAGAPVFPGRSFIGRDNVMHVKTFTGSSTSTVLASIREELGSDAVILDTRETEQDGNTVIVITAAVEWENATSARTLGSASGRASNGRGGGFAAGGAAFPSGLGSAGYMGGTGWKSWQEEWAVIKMHLLTLMKPELHLDRLTPRQRVAIEFLEREGVDATSLLAVYEALLPDPQASILAPLDNLVHVKSWSAANWPQKVHMVGGPFGAGKTTVLVRLALLLRKEAPGRKIWVVNADSRRGGGRLLLKNYAQLCGLEYREISNALEFANVLASARVEGAESILVDLPGLPRGRSMAEMLDYFGMTDPENSLHLVVTPHYGETAMHTLSARYLPAGRERNAGLIWTKLDEADKFGTLVNVAAASRLPISALSCGPELNDTLVPAESAALWRLLFKQEMPCGAPSDGVVF